MDIEADFDSYWDEEARNPNRNRIRIGRQYQAQVTPLLKPGESDNRRLEDLETLSWNPHNALSHPQLDQYFSIAKSIGLFVQAVDTCHEGLEDEEEDGSEQEERPFEIKQIGPIPSSEDANSIFATGHASSTHGKKSITTRQQRLQQQKEQQSSVDSEPGSSSPLKHTSNTRIQNALKGLSAFITAHHSAQKEKRCKANCVASAENPPINLGASEHYSLKTLSELLMGEWTANEAQIFAKALQVCGKNFSAIKKDYLPWKSVRSIIEFYYLSVDKENEQQHKKKPPSRHLDRQSKSPIDEHKKKRTSREAGPEQGTGNSNESRPETDEAASSNNNNNSGGNSNASNGASSDNGTSVATGGDSASQSDSVAKSRSSQDGGNSGPDAGDHVAKDELIRPVANANGVLSLAKGARTNGTTPKNGSLVSSDLFQAKTLNGNINGNHHHTLINDNGKPHRNSMPGQEVRPLKAKPLLQHESLLEGADKLANSTLGSLNLYLHGELVLKLNAQQQETGQKWVESMQMAPKKKLSSAVAINNGLSSNSSRLSGLKRGFDGKVASGHFFKDDTDDMSNCDVSGSDDDSMTSNESSSLVASSPSSSSTINSAAKKARVKVENLSSLASNGSSSISPPNNGRKDSGSSNGKSQQRTVSPSIIDNEMELKKKILEANLSLFRLDNSLPMLLTGVGGTGSLFEPPKAHSNSSLPSPQYPPHHPLHVSSSGSSSNSSSSASPVKSAPPAKVEPVANGHTANGFGPVDLTRKPTNGHSSELLSPSRTARNSSSSSPAPTPKAAHEASNSSASTLSPRSLASSFGLFSLPAPPPPPPNVPVSPNGHSKHLQKKSNLIRTGGVQFAK